KVLARRRVIWRPRSRKSKWRSCGEGSVRRGLLDVVDDDHIDRGLLRRQLQPKLLLDRIEEVWCFCYIRRFDLWRMSVELPIFGSERNVVVESTRDACPVHHRLVQNQHLQKVGEVSHRPIDQVQRQATGSLRVVEARVIGFYLRRRKLLSRLSN